MKQVNFKFDIGQKVWLPAMDCYAVVTSLWYSRQGVKIQCRWATNGQYYEEYLYEWEIEEKKP